MERGRFCEIAACRIAAGEAHHGGVVLAGAEVVLVDLDIVPLAGELPRVGDVLDALSLVEAPERRIGVAVGRTDDPPAGFLYRPHHQPHTAQPVVDIVRRVIEIRINRVVMPLTQHLRIGVNVSFFQRACVLYSIIAISTLSGSFPVTCLVAIDCRKV